MKVKISSLRSLSAVLLGLSISPQLTHAAIFDAADILQPQKNSVGVLAEAVLNNPSSTGAELRLKHGFNEEVNVSAILGTGSENRRTRFGALGTFNFFPDTDGQPGISLLAGGLYLKRASYGALQLSIGPIVHKSVQSFHEYPMNLYVALPWTLEFHSGSYNTALQLVLGDNFEISSGRNWLFNTEAGFSLSRSETYVALGISYRFGSFSALIPGSTSKSKANTTGSDDDGEELRSEDFNKPITK